MSANDLAAAKKAIDSWCMGKTSAIHESGGNGPGTISTGKDDLGGASYGIYQLSSKMGTLREYLDQSPYGQHFSGLIVTTPEFNAKWRELATNDPRFGRDQHHFIKHSHVDVQVNNLKSIGLDLSDRGRAVQDAIWSTSVQFRHKAPNIFLNGIKEKFGDNFKLESISDSEIVEAVQDYKIAHNNSLFKSSSGLWHGLLRRANAEKAELVELANHEVTLAKHNQLPDWRLSNHLPDFRFPNGDATIGQLQLNLNQLGFTDAHGQPLVADGKAGGPNSRTNEAIATFKQQHGLTEPMSHAELLMATQVALRVKQSLDFDRPVREGLPGPVRTPHLINGLPDYLVPGSNTLSLQSSAAQPTPDLFDRVFEALINKDDDALRAARIDYFQSADGQQLLQEGRELRHAQERKADAMALAQGRPLSTDYSIGTLTGKQDPRDWDHPDHTLYSAVRRQLPREVSDDMAAHVMLQARRGGIHNVDRLADVAVHNGQVSVAGRNYEGITLVDLSQIPPPMEDTVQQSQRLDQKLALDHQERLAQQQEQSRNGPSRSL